MKKLLTLALTVFIFCSCAVNNHTSKNTFSKRKYRKGYHFRGFAKNKQANKGNGINKQKEKQDSQKESDQYTFNDNDSSALAGLEIPQNIENNTKFEASKKQNNKLTPHFFLKGFSNHKHFNNRRLEEISGSTEEEEEKEYQKEIDSYKYNIKRAGHFERFTFAFGFHSAAFLIGSVALLLFDMPILAIVVGLIALMLAGFSILNLFKKKRSLKAADRDLKIIEENIEEDELAPFIEENKVKNQGHKVALTTILMHVSFLAIAVLILLGSFLIF